MKIKYDASLMKFISMFSYLTRVNVKDCFELDGVLVFVVPEAEVGMAIGKNGVNVKKISAVLKKPLKVVGFSDDACQFVKNYIYPIQVKGVALKDKVVVIEGNDVKSKGMLIGRDKKKLNDLTNVVKRYFDVEKIGVV